MSTRRTFLGTLGSAPLILARTDKAGTKKPVMGSGAYTYEVHHDWGELPASIKYGNTHGVVEDSQGNIYVHHTVHASSESHDTMVVFDAKGKFVRSWGAKFKGGAHGLHIQKEGKDEFLYLCDTRQAIVVKTTLKGEEVWTLGYPDKSPAYEPGADGKKKKYSPTNLCVAPNGDVYVGDGYGSSFINQYNAKGEFIRSFGGGGKKEPGSLNSPHGIWMDLRGGTPQVLVADRGNKRLHYFSLDGKPGEIITEGMDMPCHFSTYKNGDLLIPDLAAKVIVADKSNKVVAVLGDDSKSKWGETRKMAREAFQPGKFVCPHGACFDRKGNIFVAEWVEIGRVTKLRKV
jgi:sugar lactone lactonase YvrE